MSVIFTHIPKTAGTSFLRVLLKDNVEESRICFFSPGFGFPESTVVRGFKGLLFSRATRFQFYSGHLPYGIHHCIRGRAHYITFLREPIDRTISNYCFVRQRAQNPDKFHHRYKDQFDRQSLIEVLASSWKSRLNPFNGALVDNLQTRFIAGISHYGYPMKSPKLLGAAKRNLEKNYLGFGIQDRFEESTTHLAKLLGYASEARPTGPRLKRTVVNRSDMLQGVSRSDLAEFNGLDLELYDFAKDLFEYRLSNASSE